MCAKILISNGIEKRDKDMQTKAEEFFKLIDINWKEEISRNAHQTLVDVKRNSGKNILPLADDVKKLTKYLSDEVNKYLISFNKSLSNEDAEKAKTDYGSLLELILSKTIVFNRRRSGEVSRMTLDDYDKKAVTGQNEEDPIEQSLTCVERKLCHTLYRAEIVGKRGRTVPVIFNSEISKCLDLLIQHRRMFVGNANRFLFPRLFKMSTSHLRGSDCLRKHSRECGAEQPARLTSTKLRKQIATMSQVLNLKNNELDILASFLGHNIEVHREFYRLPEATLQVAKVAKVLMRMENGGVGLKAGETLDSIDLSDEKSTESESESENENDIEEISEVAHDKPHKRKPWTEQEKLAVQQNFNKYILMAKLPGKKEIEDCIKREPTLQSRTWTNIKDFIRNSSKKYKTK